MCVDSRQELRAETFPVVFEAVESSLQVCVGSGKELDGSSRGEDTLLNFFPSYHILGMLPEVRQASFENLHMIIALRKSFRMGRELIPQFADENQFLFR